jgi:hypothetical protein
VVDALAFVEYLDQGQIDAAVELYKGNFLAGLALRGAAEFEGWQVAALREGLRLRLLDSLLAAADDALRRGNHAPGQRYAVKSLELDSFNGRAYQLVTGIHIPASEGEVCSLIHIQIRDPKVL